MIWLAVFLLPFAIKIGLRYLKTTLMFLHVHFTLTRPQVGLSMIAICIVAYGYLIEGSDYPSKMKNILLYVTTS